MSKCVNHTFPIILSGEGIKITNQCNKCGRYFSKEVMRRVLKIDS